MKLNQRLTLAVAFCLIASLTFAQGGFRQGGRRGGAGGGVAGLLRRPDVRADLQLSADQTTKLDSLAAQMRANRPARGATPTAADRDAMRAAEVQAEAVLSPDQDHRLHEIQIQLEGDRAALRKEVQDHLDLTPDQVARLKELEKNYRAASLSIRDKQMNKEIDRQTARADEQKNTQTLTDQIHQILSPGQLDKMKEMGGRPFVATEPMGRGRRGGGGL